MTQCPCCSVNLVDRRCGHEEPVCYDCCSTRATIRTCRYHFDLMGSSTQTVRSAAGLGPPFPGPPVLQLLASAPQGGGGSGSSSSPIPGSSLPASAVPPSGSLPSAPLDLASLTAMMTASITAALQPVQAELASLRAGAPAPLSPPVPPLIPPPAAGLLPVPPPSPAQGAGPVPPPPPPPPSPPPHRAALLGALSDSNSTLADLIRLLTSPDYNVAPSDVREVRPQSNTHVPLLPPLSLQSSLAAPTPPARFNPLPAEMIPRAAGSAEDNTQLLTSLITTFHKTTVKYNTLKALDEGLEDWWVKASKSGTWTGTQLMSVANYRAFLVHELGPTRPLSKVLEYHRLFTAAVNEGDHDMFQTGGHYIPHLYLKAGLLEPLKSASAFHPPRKGGKSAVSDEPGTATGTVIRKRHPDSGKHPAGSCANHPTSTTHTTAECKAK
jgi:hypothetical protein